MHIFTKTFFHEEIYGKRVPSSLRSAKTEGNSVEWGRRVGIFKRKHIVEAVDLLWLIKIYR